MALRASELRGLRWEDVDLSKNELHVRRRADRYNKIGKPKSAAGARTVPLIPYVVNVLREHKLASKTKDGLVFPNGKGKIDSLANIVGFGLKPAMIRAGKRAVVLTGFGNPTSGPPSAYPSSWSPAIRGNGCGHPSAHLRSHSGLTEAAAAVDVRPMHP